jgi:hypothetical protein
MESNSNSKKDEAKGTQIPKNNIGPKYCVKVQIIGFHPDTHDKRNRLTRETNDTKLSNFKAIEILSNLFSKETWGYIEISPSY